MDHLWITELHSRLEKDIIKGLHQQLEKEQQQKQHGQTTSKRTEMTLKRAWTAMDNRTECRFIVQLTPWPRTAEDRTRQIETLNTESSFPTVAN